MLLFFGFNPTLADPPIIQSNDATTRPNNIEQHIDDSMFEEIAMCTNQQKVLVSGASLNTSSEELKTFFGNSIYIGYLGYPNIQIYWAANTSIAVVAKSMTRNGFYKLRNPIQHVNDLDVCDDDKKGRISEN